MKICRRYVCAIRLCFVVEPWEWLLHVLKFVYWANRAVLPYIDTIGSKRGLYQLLKRNVNLCHLGVV